MKEHRCKNFEKGQISQSELNLPLPEKGTKDYDVLVSILARLENTNFQIPTEIGVFTRLLLKDTDEYSNFELKTFYDFYDAILDKQKELLKNLNWSHLENLFDIIHEQAIENISKNLIVNISDQQIIDLMFCDIKKIKNDQIDFLTFISIISREKYIQLKLDNQLISSDQNDFKSTEISDLTTNAPNLTQISNQSIDNDTKICNISDQKDKISQPLDLETNFSEIPLQSIISTKTTTNSGKIEKTLAFKRPYPTLAENSNTLVQNFDYHETTPPPKRCFLNIIKDSELSEKSLDNKNEPKCVTIEKMFHNETYLTNLNPFLNVKTIKDMKRHMRSFSYITLDFDKNLIKELLKFKPVHFRKGIYSGSLILQSLGEMKTYLGRQKYLCETYDKAMNYIDHTTNELNMEKSDVRPINLMLLHYFLTLNEELELFIARAKSADKYFVM